jgi:signal transduction histidine kinase
VVEIALLEQRRIGQQLHDDCGQQLTALAILSDSLEHSLLEAQSADAPLARKIEEGLKTVLRQVRNISRGLVCAEVSPNGLRAALAELTSRLCETSGVRCALHIDDAVRIADALLATHLYHIAQEACTNALKHARASNIEVALVLREGRTVLEVRDDGVGLPDECEEGLGLRIMRNRAGVIGAELTIEAAAQRRQSEPRGTLVTCTLKPERPHGPSKKQLRRHA